MLSISPQCGDLNSGIATLNLFVQCSEMSLNFLSVTVIISSLGGPLDVGNIILSLFTLRN